MTAILVLTYGEIAAWMTQAERDVLMSFPANGGGMVSYTPEHLCPAADAVRDFRPPLIAFGGAHLRWHLTHLGRAVRAALADASADGDVA